MKVGLLPLSVAVMVAAARVFGSPVTADVLGAAYLVVATVLMARMEEVTSPSRV